MTDPDIQGFVCPLLAVRDPRYLLGHIRLTGGAVDVIADQRPGIEAEQHYDLTVRAVLHLPAGRILR